MKNKLLIFSMLVCALAASYTDMAQGFIGNGSGAGIEAVNSSGVLTSPNVNVGIGVAVPSGGATLEVANPSGGSGSLVLKFDNLPLNNTPTYFLSYDGVGTVKYSPAPAGGPTTVDYNCGIGTVTVNGVTSAHKAWLLSGSTTATDSSDYFGTYNDDDIRIVTNDESCVRIPLEEKMVIGRDEYNGNVEIGWDHMTPLPSPATSNFNKFLVQNGTVSATPLATGLSDLNTFLLASPPITGQDIGIAAYANQTVDAYNYGIASFADNPSAQNSIGFLTMVDNATAQNIGAFIGVGTASTTANTNYGAQVNVTGSSTVNYGVYSRAGSTPLNPATDINNAVFGGAGGSSYTVYNNPRGNIGVWGNANGGISGASENTGVKGDATGGPGSYNAGFLGNVIGTSTLNVGFNLVVNGDDNNAWAGPGTVIAGNAPGTSSKGNFGMYTGVYGNTSVNIGGMGEIIEPSTTTHNNNGSRVYGLIGSIAADATSTCTSRVGVWGKVLNTNSSSAYNYGVWGDLSTLPVPTSNTIAYYAIFGQAPQNYGLGVRAPRMGGNGIRSYAGYFEGDVFCSNAYYYSDPKLKENIKTYSGALDQLKKLPIKSYTFKNDEYPNLNLPLGDQVGVLSTDLKAVFPNLVKGGMHPKSNKSDDQDVFFDAVNYTALIPVLVEAVQELNAKTDSVTTNTALTNTVAAQQAQIAQQAQQIAELRTMIEDLCNNGCAGFNPKGNNSTGSGNAVLDQSVPNPTSGLAVIGYSINMPFSVATIQISDNGGKTIKQFTLAQQQGAGSVTFDGGSVAAGSYTYSLILDGKVYDTKTMVILKN